MLWLVAAGALFVGVKWSLVLGALAYLVGYAGSCAWFPLASCYCCHGDKKHVRKDGKVFRKCVPCGGRGARRRFGRVVWDLVTPGEHAR